MHVGPISDKTLSLYLRVLNRIINKSTRFVFCIEMKECSRTPVGLDGLWGRGGVGVHFSFWSFTAGYLIYVLPECAKCSIAIRISSSHKVNSEQIYINLEETSEHNIFKSLNGKVQVPFFN